MVKGEAVYIFNVVKKHVHLNLGEREASYIAVDNSSSCMINAWDFKEAERIYNLHNSTRRKRRRKRELML